MSNWASLDVGARLVGFSSEVEGCEAENVLNPRLSQLWLSQGASPQWLCISLGQLSAGNVCIRTIGWHCWHPYSTNPMNVTIHISGDGSKFKVWDTFHAVKAKGTQLFCCAPISSAIYPFIALEVVETFGGMQTYMNRIYMFSDEIASSSLTGLPDLENLSP